MSTKKYFLVFLSKYFKYYCIVGSGLNLNKVGIQSKNYVLNFLRSKKLLKYTNNYIFSFDFEVHLKTIINENNNVIYEQNILEESFSFYLMAEDELKLLKKDFDVLDESYVFAKLFFVEDKKMANYVLNNRNYHFDTQIIQPIRNYTNIYNITNKNTKYRNCSI